MSHAVPRRRGTVLAVVLIVVGAVLVIAASPIGTTHGSPLAGTAVPAILMVIGGALTVLGVVTALRVFGASRRR